MAEWPTRTTANGAVVLRPEGRLNMVCDPVERELGRQAFPVKPGVIDDDDRYTVRRRLG